MYFWKRSAYYYNYKTESKKVLRNLKKAIDFVLWFCYSSKSLLKERHRERNVLWKLSKTSILSSRLNINSKKIFFWRVWSWLRMNAGGMPKTCKSNEMAQWKLRACTRLDLDYHLVADGWVTRGWPTFKLGITVGNDC